MKRVYVTSIFRKERGDDGGARIYCIDVDSGNILESKTYPHRLRGMAWIDGHLFIGGDIKPGGKVDCLLELDPSTLEIVKWKKYKQIFGTHLVEAKDNKLYICSTRNDKLVIIKDWEVVEQKKVPGGSHFNSICWCPLGEEYRIYNGQSRIHNVTKGYYSSVKLRGPHDIGFINGGHMVVNSSRANKTLLLDSRGRLVKVILKTEDKNNQCAGVSQWGFTRGLAICRNEGVFITGSAPGTLHFFYISGLKKYAEIVLSDTNYESIYDISMHPDDWKL